MKNYIKALKGKIARYVGIMYKITLHVRLQVRVQIFYSFAQSHFNFCALVWGFAAKSHIESLFAQRKKGMRAIKPGLIKFLPKRRPTK